MSFHYSAQDIRVDDGHILRARLQRGDGEYNDAEIDLNDHIGADNGNLVWNGQGFSHSSEDISFSLEGDGVPILRANVRDNEGNVQGRDLNLGERFGNNDGNFTYND